MVKGAVLLGPRTTHAFALILPAIAKLVLPDTPPAADPPDGLPYALAHDACNLGPPSSDLVLQDLDPCVELPAGELGAVPARTGNDVGEAQARERRVLTGTAEARGDVAGAEQAPEKVGRVGVGVARPGGLNARIQPDKEDEHVRV